MTRVLTLVFCTVMLPSFAQDEVEWESNYHHYWGTYERTLSCKHLLTKKHRDSLSKANLDYGVLTVGLWWDGGYYIHLWGVKSVNGQVVDFDYELEGTYTVNEMGLVKLNGDHPFVSDEFQIIESFWNNQERNYVSGRGFKYKLNDSYKWIRRRRGSTFCDGCIFNPDE